MRTTSDSHLIHIHYLCVKKKTGELKLLFRNTQEINRISGVGQILMEDYVGKKLALYKSIFTFIQFTLRFPFEIVAEDITG